MRAGASVRQRRCGCSGQSSFGMLSGCVRGALSIDPSEVGCSGGGSARMPEPTRRPGARTLSGRSGVGLGVDLHLKLIRWRAWRCGRTPSSRTKVHAFMRTQASHGRPLSQARQTCPGDRSSVGPFEQECGEAVVPAMRASSRPERAAITAQMLAQQSEHSSH